MIIVDSNPEFIKINIGNRLNKKERFTEVFTVIGHILGVFIIIDDASGIIKKIRDNINDELNINIWFITFTWSCT